MKLGNGVSVLMDKKGFSDQTHALTWYVHWDAGTGQSQPKLTRSVRPLAPQASFRGGLWDTFRDKSQDKRI